ncbi:MAG: ATP-binding cassette domain-containing protein [Deltaproteobacteria bacterium]|nr:MAG: ATP-binding cassette domain-containing protein [Deltaproteobacteria bacterium]
MIQVQDVTKAFAGKKLFESVSTTFPPLRRYGLTGPNGAGKTTFMQILSGDLDPDTGMVSRPKRFSVLKQDQYGYEDKRVIDVVLMGNQALWEAMQEKDRLLAKQHLSDEDGSRLGELEGVIAEEDGYSAEAQAATLLQGLGVFEEDHHRLMREVTGGNKVRVLLAQALFGRPTALLLDEPTNSLDLDSVHWLEDFLLQYEGTLVVISHDRHFLNAICTHIADIDYETIITYVGNYDDMVRAKAQVRSRIESENADKMKKRAQLQEFVARFSAGTRASQVQSRIKQLEKLSVTDIKKSNIARPFIKFEQKRPSGKQTLTMEGLSKGFLKGKPLFKSFSALITKGEKVAVVGRNGAGKTTLLRTLLGELEPDAGKVTWGHEAQIGYMPQDVRPVIPTNTTCFDYLHDIDPSAGNEEIRGLLGRMLFRGDEGMKPTKALSGGEAVRLLFCKLMLVKPNVLVLDEPTNHLDLESISALGDGLMSYPGTVIFVAHDRDLIDTAATRILAFTHGGLEDFAGDYETFLTRHGGFIDAR